MEKSIWGIMIIIFILSIITLLYFCSLCLKKREKKYNNENNEEDIIKTEKNLYLCGISCCVFVSIICIIFEKNFIIKFVPTVITGMSLICRLNKKRKISNILYGVLVLFTLISILILIVKISSDIFPHHEDTISEDQLRKLEIAEFNSKFINFEGEIRGATVNQMLQTVISNNMAQDNISRQVEVVFSDSINIKPILQDDTNAPKVKTGELYQVKCEYSDKKEDEGLIYCILITKQGDTEPQPIHTMK